MIFCVFCYRKLTTAETLPMSPLKRRKFQGPLGEWHGGEKSQSGLGK